MNVRKKSETPTTLTVEWDPVTGQRGYETTRPDGVKYRQWTTTKREHTFKNKTDGIYLVDVFGNLDSGSYEQDSTPGPDPTPAFGADLRAAFPPLTGLPVADDAGKPPRTTRVYLGSADSNRHFKNVRRTGPGGDGFKLSDNVRNVRFDLCSTYDLTDPNLQMAWNFQPGNGGTCDNIQIYGGVNHGIGTVTRDHAAYFGAGTRNVLMAGVLNYDYEGYGAHLYPGPATRVYHANCTLVGSRQREGVIVTSGDDILFVNSIIDGIDSWFGGVNVRFIRCCITGNRPNGPTYTDCIYEDPDLDANFKPRNPKLIAGGLPGWVPPWDCGGAQYTRATIGAVAA